MQMAASAAVQRGAGVSARAPVVSDSQSPTATPNATDHAPLPRPRSSSMITTRPSINLWDVNGQRTCSPYLPRTRRPGFTLPRAPTDKSRGNLLHARIYRIAALYLGV